MKTLQLKSWAITALCMLLAIPALAQEPLYLEETDNDVQLRTSINVTKKFKRGWSLEWNEELRMKNTFKDLDRIYSEVEANYKPLRWMKIGAKYSFISIRHDGKKSTNYQKYWDLRHRVSTHVTFSHKTYSRWEFSLRELAQVTFLTEDGIDKREKSSPEWMLKSRLMAEYSFWHKPIKPFAYIELVNTLNAPKLADGNYLSQIRSALGFNYRFNMRNSIQVLYRFDYKLDKDIDIRKKTGELKSITREKEYNHIFSIGYKYTF